MPKNFWAFLKNLYNRYPFDGLPSFVLKLAKVHIPHAQILTLRATPIVLVKAIPDNIIVPARVIAFAGKTTPYTEAADNISIAWHNGDNFYNALELDSTNLLTGADNFALRLSSIGAITQVGRGGISGKDLVVRNSGDAEIGAGAVGQYLDIALVYYLLSKEDYTF